MAIVDSTAHDNATPEQWAEQFPCNTAPFAVWYEIDSETYCNWEINDENGDGFTSTMHYKTALILSEALRMRHEKISNKWLILDVETQNAINNALLIGLESYGEIERISDEVKMADHCPNVYKLPDSVRPIHPTGSADTIGVFAAALRYMQRT